MNTMMNKKRCFSACALLTFMLLGGCFGKTVLAGEEKPIRIVTTIFPVYDWVENILGDHSGQAEVNMLLDNGVDLHSYQPTAEDILEISTCDLFIYVGGASDAWVEDALHEKTNEDMVVLNLLNELGDSVREEEIVEGMQEEEEEGGHEETEYDEHIWLSLRNAAALVEVIADALETLDPENADAYGQNARAYIGQINELDAAYEKAVQEAPVHTILFGDRFPFRYMTEDYDLTYYAAFAGCSAETEASFETIAFLAQKLDELGLKVCLTIEGTDHAVARTIVQSTKTKDQQILSLDSMQSVGGKDEREEVSYLAIMEKNLEILREALQ